MKDNNLNIYIDGASSGNPGKAGVGVVIEKNGKIVKQISKYIGETTNNVAEYKALILALQEAGKLNPKSIKIFSDSELLINQVTGEYRVKSKQIKSLFDKVAKLAQRFRQVDIEKISKNKNKKADRLANKAITKSQAIFPKHPSS